MVRLDGVRTARKAKLSFCFCYRHGVLLFRRLAYSVADFFLIDDPPLRMLGFGLISLASFVLHVSARPYRDALPNALESAALVALVVQAMYLSAVSAAPPYSTQQQIAIMVLVTAPALGLGGVIARWYWRQRSAKPATVHVDEPDDAYHLFKRATSGRFEADNN